MRIALTVVIYDRTKNLKAWCCAWALSRVKYPDVEFRVICNNPENFTEYQKQVEGVGGVFIARGGLGFDVGTLQDVARKRLVGFEDYDFLLWCCDDLLPIRPDFLDIYLASFFAHASTELRVFEMALSPLRHVRTTGLLLPRTFVERLEFVVDPVITKEHCYKFELRDKENHFLLQLERAGYIAKQIAPIVASPLWDSGRKGRYLTPREKDFQVLWPEVYDAWCGIE